MPNEGKPKSVWKGKWNLGGVDVPVTMHSVLRSERSPKMHLCHLEDEGELQQQYVCKTCGKIVSNEEKGKFYPVKTVVNGQPCVEKAVFTLSEYKAMSLQSSEKMNTIAFKERNVEGSIPDVAVFSGYRFYVLGSDEKADADLKCYAWAMATLKEAEKQGKVAIATVTMRGKQHLFMLFPFRNSYGQDVIGAVDLPFVDAIRKDVLSQVQGSTADVSEDFINVGKKIIEKLSKTEFDYEKLHEQFETQLKEYITKKLAGEEIKLEAKPLSAKTVSLEAQLQNLAL